MKDNPAVSICLTSPVSSPACISCIRQMRCAEYGVLGNNPRISCPGPSGVRSDLCQMRINIECEHSGFCYYYCSIALCSIIVRWREGFYSVHSRYVPASWYQSRQRDIISHSICLYVPYYPPDEQWRLAPGEWRLRHEWSSEAQKYRGLSRWRCGPPGESPRTGVIPAGGAQATPIVAPLLAAASRAPSPVASEEGLRLRCGLSQGCGSAGLSSSTQAGCRLSKQTARQACMGAEACRMCQRAHAENLLV